MTDFLSKSQKSFLATLALTVALPMSAAVAQTAPQPSRSVETFATWDVECTAVKVRVNKEAGKKKDAKKKKDDKKKKDAKAEEATVETRTICEAVQPYRNRKTNNEVARMAVGLNSKKKGEIVAVLRTLTNMSFSKTPAIVDADKELVKGEFRSCFNKYCYINFAIGKKTFDAILKAKKLGVQYPVSSGEMIRMGMSANGLSDAVTSLRSK